MFLLLASLAAINALFITIYDRIFGLDSAHWNVAISTSLAVVFLLLAAVT